MTNLSGDIAETPVTDSFTLSKFGRVSGSTTVWIFGPVHASKVDRMDACDNGHRSVWPTLYVEK